MILIQSIESDIITEYTIRWLNFKEVEYTLLTNDVVKSSTYSIGNKLNCILLNINGKSIKLTDINVVWYRRSTFTLDTKLNKNKYPKVFEDNIKKFENKEYTALRQFIFTQLENKFIINSPKDEHTNKLQNLQNALKVGLEIPETFITNQYLNLDISFEVIIKPISEIVNFYYKQYQCLTRTELFSSNKINDFPTLFQKRIPKYFEIRTFYLRESCYSIAIFSQSNDNTLLDYRNYDLYNPTRSVPYKLPDLIEQKLIALMKSLKLNSGSIDIIYSTNNKYIFLEINPLGQFYNVSYYGNYYLEKKIAEMLIKYGNKY